MLALAGCGPRVYPNPIGVMLNRQQDPAWRLAAAQQAARASPGDPQFLGALDRLLWDPGHPFELRRFAADTLLAADEATFRRNLARRISIVPDFETLKHLLGIVESRAWPEATAVAVRAYARPMHGIRDAERPERRTLEKLNPGRTVEQAVFGVFVTAGEAVGPIQQDAAWQLLNRLVPRGQLMEMLAAAPPNTALVADLRAAAADLHTVPTRQEGTLHLRWLRQEARRPLWDAAKAVAARLTPEQRAGLDLRHVPVLIRLDDATLALSRAALSAKVRAALGEAEHHLKSPAAEQVDPDYPQQFHQGESKLAWADLATIDLLLSALRDRAVVTELFAQADADLANPGTEFGGVLDVAGGWAAPRPAPGAAGFRAQGYPPERLTHDRKFLAPPAMIEHVYTALAHYHFHAQAHRNGAYAGPGKGDLELVDRLRFNGLLFTFVAQDALNVDYYQAGGVVVDLGTVRR